MGCHFLLQGIFPTQGLNPGLQHCRQILYHLSHQGSPRQCKTIPVLQRRRQRVREVRAQASQLLHGRDGNPGLLCLSLRPPPYQCLLHRLPGAADPPPRTTSRGAASLLLICVHDWQPGWVPACPCREERLASVCTSGIWPFPLSSQMAVTERGCWVTPGQGLL